MRRFAEVPHKDSLGVHGCAGGAEGGAGCRYRGTRRNVSTNAHI